MILANFIRAQKSMTRILIFIVVVITWPVTSYAVAAGQAIEMSLTALDGSTRQLSDFEGKWVVVNYWATWCRPCITEMPELQSFHDNNIDKAVVIGINSELTSKDQLRQFLEDYSITYPIFTSKPAGQSELGMIPGLPTTFLVSPQGKVEARQVGGVTRDMLEKFIQKWESQ